MRALVLIHQLVWRLLMSLVVLLSHLTTKGNIPRWMISIHCNAEYLNYSSLFLNCPALNSHLNNL